MKDLGTTPTGGNGRYACGLGIDSHGDPVGEPPYQKNPTGIVDHAFVPDEGPEPPHSRELRRVRLTAYSINGAAQIVGDGTIRNQQHAFLWTPAIR